MKFRCFFVRKKHFAHFYTPYSNSRRKERGGDRVEMYCASFSIRSDSFGWVEPLQARPLADTLRWNDTAGWGVVPVFLGVNSGSPWSFTWECMFRVCFPSLWSC